MKRELEVSYAKDQLNKEREQFEERKKMRSNSGKMENKDKKTDNHNPEGIFYKIKQSMGRLEDTEDKDLIEQIKAINHGYLFSLNCIELEWEICN